MDLEGRVNTFNRAAERMFEVKAEEILNRPYSKVLTAEHTALIEGILKELKDKAVPRIRREIPVVVRGTPLILFITVSIMEDARGRNVGTVFVIEDMTTLINAQRKAAWSEAAKRIAHEIKNPLTPIQLSAERIRRRLDGRLDEDDARVLREGTDSIVREVDAMRHLVDEFSQFARLPVLKAVPGDINKAVQEAVALFRVVGEGVGIIQLSLNENLPRISFDDEQMRRVIINLLDNAIRAVGENSEDGIVSVSTGIEESGMVAVTVSDNGPGIPSELMDRIFDPYFSTREGGTGLGLAIAKRVVEEHGGKLDCAQGPLAGAQFTIRIPVDIDPMRRT